MPNFKSNPSAESYLRLDPKSPEIDSTIKEVHIHIWIKVRCLLLQKE